MSGKSTSRWRSRGLKLPGKIVRAVLSFVRSSGPSQPYQFEQAKSYWANVPRAEGENPFHSQSLDQISDEALLADFLREVEIARNKPERRVGFDLAAESLTGLSAPRVMDYGSGIGFYGHEILTRIADSHVTFVDINESNLAAIKRILTLRGLVDRAAFAVVEEEGAENLDFEKPFDFMISMGVLHHTPHAPRIVGHLTRFLKEGAIFEIMLYNHRYLFEMQCVAGRKLNDTTFGHMTDPEAQGLKNPFSEAYDDEKAKQLFTGYDLVSADYPNRFYNTYRFRKRRSS